MGVVLLLLGPVGSATLVSGAMFPLLARSSLAFEVWVGAVAWHWLRPRVADPADVIRSGRWSDQNV